MRKLLQRAISWLYWSISGGKPEVPVLTCDENRSGYTPPHDLVLFLVPPVQDVTPGGIALPKISQEKEMRATRIAKLVAIGPEAYHHPRAWGLKMGDMVLLPRYAGDFLPIGDEMYVILKVDAIHGKMDKVPNYEIRAARSAEEVFPTNAPPSTPKEAAPRIITMR